MRTVNFLKDIATLSSGQMRLIEALPDYKYILYGGKAGPGKTWTSVATAAHVVGSYAALGIKANVALASRDQKQVVARYADAIQEILIDPGLGQIQGATDKSPAAFNFYDPAFGKIILLGLHDVRRLRGKQFAGLGIDELTEISEEEWHDIYWRVRFSTKGKVKPFPFDPIWATSNPDGPGSYWVFEYFVSRTFNTPFGANMAKAADQFHYIEASSSDNPDTEYMHEYQAVLDKLPEHLRRARLESVWDPTEGARFPYPYEFIDPTPVHDWYQRFRGLDWGFANDPCATVWAYFDEHLNCYVYRMKKILGKSIYAAGKELIEATQDEKIRLTGADPSLWTRNPADVNLKTLESEFRRAGLPLTQSTNKHEITNAIIEKYLERNNGFPNLYFIRGGEGVAELVTDLRTLRWNTGPGDPNNLVPHSATHSVYALGYLLHKANPTVMAPSEVSPERIQRVRRLLRQGGGGSKIIRKKL